MDYENEAILKTYPVFKPFSGSEWKIEVTDKRIRMNRINAVDSAWTSKYITIATKEEPMADLLYWNQGDRDVVDYLSSNHIGSHSSKAETNYDQDPYGRHVQRGTRTWYRFDFSKLWE